MFQVFLVLFFLIILLLIYARKTMVTIVYFKFISVAALELNTCSWVARCLKNPMFYFFFNYKMFQN